MKYVALLLSLFISLSALATTKPAFLFVCTGNTGRSPMAEALANDVLDFDASGYPDFSRGINVNSEKTARETNAIIVMKELGADISATEAKTVTGADINASTWVLAMTRAHKEQLIARAPSAAAKIKMLSECATGREQDIEDAYGQDLSFYRQTRDQMATYIADIQEHGFTCTKA